MWPSKRGGSISKSMDTRINVGLGNGSNFGNDSGVNVDSKIGIESQSYGSGSHSYSSSISLKWKLANLSMGWYWSSSKFCGEIESWSKSSRYHDSWVIELGLHKNTEFQNFKIKSASAQFYRNSKWLCGSWSTTVSYTHLTLPTKRIV